MVTDNATLEIIKQMEEVIEDIGIQSINPEQVQNPYKYRSQITKLHTKIYAILYMNARSDSPYNKNCQIYLQCFQNHTMHPFEKGFFKTINKLITSDIFADFLEMTEYFLSQGDLYKHPATFLFGGVLEEHLRKLAIKNEISTINDNGQPWPAEDLNMDLIKNGVFPRMKENLQRDGWGFVML